MGLFSRKKYIEKVDFPYIIESLSDSFEALREDFLYGSLTQLKREEIDVSGISRDITLYSELEDALKGFQLTSMIGIAWDYIKDINEQIEFDDMLSAYIGAEEGTRAWEFRNRYVYCQGDMDRITKALSIHVHKAIGSPTPRGAYLVQFTGAAYVLVMMCQAETCRICGDKKKEKKIRKTMMSNLY